MFNGNALKLMCLLLVMSAATSIPLLGQQGTRQITGAVKDVAGDPMPGVNVIQKGTTNGTVTNIDGHFTLKVPSSDVVLVFSFIGYNQQEIPVTDQTTVNLTMIESSQEIEEVVVVGYGIQRKESVVGAISQTTNEDLKRQGTVSDLRQALSGQIPGLVSLTSSGEPGGVTTGQSATNMYIRGQTSWNGGQPLVLIDGVERDMSTISINEVESISVLKDASATAVFGVKGANGVILINTKRGAEGKTSLNFNYTATGTFLSKQPKKLDSYAALMAKNEMIEREVVMNEPSWGAYMPYEIVERYRKPQSEEYALIYPNIDWEEALYKTMGLSHQASVNVQGGNKIVKFFGSLTYLHQGDNFKEYDNGKGYSPNYNYDRFNFRSNVDFSLTNTTTLKVNLSGSYGLKNTNYNNDGSSSRADWWIWAASYRAAPDMSQILYPDGLWGTYAEGGNNTANPVAIVYNLGIRKARTTLLQSDIILEQDLKFITPGLKLIGSFNLDTRTRSESGIYDVVNHIRGQEEGANVAYRQIYPLLYEGPDQDPSEYTKLWPVGSGDYDWVIRPWTNRTETIGTENWQSYLPVNRNMQYRFQLNYNRKFDVHNVLATGVFQREQWASGEEFKHYREDWIFRAAYDYDSRYMAEFNGAYNGSEQFSPDYRFAFFPSVAVGWYISNENFMSGVEWLDRLKFRYSYGKVGDDSMSGVRWMYDSQYAYGGNSGIGSNNNVVSTSPYTYYRLRVNGNPNLHWETAVKNNFGVDFGAFKNLISVTFDYYTEDRTGILMSASQKSNPPFYVGVPSSNTGHVKSKGFELELGFMKNVGDFYAKTTLAVTHNKSEVIFRDDPPLLDDYLKQQGYQIGQNKRLLNTGYFYQNWDDVFASIPTENNDLQKLPGYYDMIDFNADGIIKGNEDTPPVGYSEIPQNTASLSVGFGYKGWSFSVQFFGVNNCSRFIGFDNYVSDTNLVFEHAADYWSKDNPYASSFLPRWKTAAENIGHYFLYDASYVRLRMAEISYSFNNQGWVQKAGINNLRIFLNGNNLFFWSNLPDDRETTYSDSGSATQGAYPTVKSVNLGIELAF